MRHVPSPEFLLIVASCAALPRGDGVVYGKVCHAPELVIVEDTASEWLVHATRDAVTFWNAVAGHPILLYGGPANIPYTYGREPFIVVRAVEVEHQAQWTEDQIGGATPAYEYFDDGSKCIRGTAVWVVDTAQKTYPAYLRWIAAHEIGHALGLDHSYAIGTIMFPKRQKGDPYPHRLGEDTKEELELLYGKGG